MLCTHTLAMSPRSEDAHFMLCWMFAEALTIAYIATCGDRECNDIELGVSVSLLIVWTLIGIGLFYHVHFS